MNMIKKISLLLVLAAAALSLPSSAVTPVAGPSRTVYAAYRTTQLTRTSNATLSNDDTLVISNLPVGVYELTGFVMVVGTANSGSKCRINLTNASETGTGYGMAAISGVSSGVPNAVGTWATSTRSSATSNTSAMWSGTITVTSAPGTVAVQWAQNQSHADATTIWPSSYLKLVKF